jgi:ribonuclease T2
MRAVRILVAFAMAWASPAAARDRAGDFDYYVLALSWSPTWCAAAPGRASEAEQCDPRRRLGFVVHGLWPQHRRGWPEHCATDRRGPTRAETAAMADLMGSAGLAWAQWRKHGRCTGLDGGAYLRLTREAFARVRIPPPLTPAALAPGGGALELSPAAIKAAFLRANPGFPAEGVTVLCAEGRLREVRLCLTRELAPRACEGDVARDCRARSVSMPKP